MNGWANVRLYVEPLLNKGPLHVEAARVARAEKQRLTW
jgi:hypothetical protein